MFSGYLTTNKHYPVTAFLNLLFLCTACKEIFRQDYRLIIVPFGTCYMYGRPQDLYVQIFSRKISRSLCSLPENVLKWPE